MVQAYSAPRNGRLTSISFNWRGPCKKKWVKNFFSRHGSAVWMRPGSSNRARTSPDPAILLLTARRANDTHNVTVVEDVGFSKTHSTPSVDTVQNVLAQVSMNS